MRPTDQTEKQLPLGEPTNRKVVAPRPVPGRPNWFYGKDNVPYYVEPTPPPVSIYEFFGMARP